VKDWRGASNIERAPLPTGADGREQSMYQPLTESIQATMDRVNKINIAPEDMIEAIAYTNRFEAHSPTLIDMSHHLQFDLGLANEKIEAILLRAIALIRTVEYGVAGSTWGEEGTYSQISNALVGASALAPLRYIERTIRFDPDELLIVGLERSETLGSA
jgi:hypothetical protein